MTGDRCQGLNRDIVKRLGSTADLKPIRRDGLPLQSRAGPGNVQSVSTAVIKVGNDEVMLTSRQCGGCVFLYHAVQAVVVNDQLAVEIKS